MCPACQNTDYLVWAHHGGKDIHRWDDSDEKDCPCQPKAICTKCDVPLLREFGFVVLDAACFGHHSATMQ